MALVTAILLILLFSYSRISVDKESKKIATAISEQFQTFEEAVVLYQQSALPFQAQLGVDFIVFDQFGKVKAWTNNQELPKYEQFLLSPNDKMITTRQGEYLFQLFESLQSTDKIVAYTLVHRSFGEKTLLLTDEYNRKLIPTNIEIGYDESAIPIQYQSTDLFSIQWTGNAYYDQYTNWLMLVLLLVFFATSYITIYQGGVFVQVYFGFKYAIMALILALLGFRGVMVGLGFPSEYIRTGIFSETVFRFEWFFTTLGDAVLNVAGINLIIVFMIAQWKHTSHNGRTAKIVAILFFPIGYFSLYLFADTIQILLDHSQLSLDISESLKFSLERMVAFLLVALMAIFYFLQSYFAFELQHRKSYSWRQFLSYHAISLVLVGVLMHEYIYVWVILAGNLIYTSLLFGYQFPTNLRKLKFESLNYLMLSTVLMSSVGAYVIFHSAEERSFQRMDKFATHLQLNREFDKENSLAKTIRKIENDVIINSKMLTPTVQKKQLLQRIKYTYLNTYFSNYEIELSLFDKAGKPKENPQDSISFESVRTAFNASPHRTRHKNIFFDGSLGLGKRQKYICLVTMKRYQSITGYLKIELRLKKFSSKRVLPQLLMGTSQEGKSFDYGIFQGHGLVYKSGGFEYETVIESHWWDTLYTGARSQEIKEDNQLYYTVSLGDKRIVITSKTYALANIVSNFSFLFVVLLSLGSALILGNYLLYPQRRVALSFSTKILLYTGASFIIPLVIVGSAVMTSTDLSNRKEIDKSNLKKAGLMTENLNDYLWDFNNGEINKEALENAVAMLSIHAGMDINLYGKRGTLLASSTPEIFDNNILSAYLAPRAMATLNRGKKENIILDERVGSFQYKSSYLSILSQETGAFLGVLGSPYFASKNHLKRQQLAVFGNIINIFTFVFILSILIAYFVISKITRPIVAIADKLHDTGFAQTNQPIEWTADDEIGTLVKEYNNMLEKLEISKQELAQTEKEAAWREMAKQVAHEIKNPLTPMKLTIQHLQRLFADQADKKKSLDILLSQIDTLDEIVTSFSHFAKMPIPESEPFDISEILQRSIDLHVDKSIVSKMSEGIHLVMGDKKLFGRIFNNLILNGFQAMKTLQSSQMEVELTATQTHIEMTFADHGEGIDPSIADKVFTPNFSTKKTGSGIGLAVAKRGIEHAGGEIYYESKVGDGTVFKIKIPLIADPS